MSPQLPAPQGLVVVRRRHSQVPREKTSLSLRADVLAAAKAVVLSGEAENLSAFVELAVQEKLRRTKRDALYAAYEAAARDDQFRQNMAEVMRDFAVTDSDGV